VAFKKNDFFGRFENVLTSILHETYMQ